MSIVWWDIETRANERSREYYEQHWTPPGNMSKPETIAAAKAKQLETLEGAGLRWWTGAVCCICAESSDGSSFTEVNVDESVLLTNFFDYCRKQEAASDVSYVGHFGTEFDGPFVVGRALALSLKLPYKLCDKGNKSPLRDIMRIWGWKRGDGQIGKLSDIAWGLGLHPKSAHGSEVQSFWDQSRYSEIQSYCKDDVRIVKEIYERWIMCTE